MSFTGDLQHLPIIDIVQLLHQTRKSGTLCLRSPKGESQLVFKDGYIVSVNHHNNSIRIGQILVEMGALTREEVERTVQEQAAGEVRKPLIAILLESGKIDKKTAFKGLETLIELTIVEVLTWDEGSFTLDISAEILSDEYRYFPEKLNEEMVLDTQNVLMDALRIFDERNRDGVEVENDWLREEGLDISPPATAASPEATLQAAEPVEDDLLLSLEDLGLEDLDTLERKIPQVFSGLKDEDTRDEHLKVVTSELRDMRGEDRERFLAYLTSFGHTPDGRGDGDGGGQSVILLSRDELLRHSMTTAGRHEGFFVTATDDADHLDMVIDQSANKGILPVFIIDAPDAEGSAAFGEASLLELRQQKRRKYPALPVIQLVGRDDSDFSLQALQEGVRAVFAKPSRQEGAEYVDRMIRLLDAVRAYIRQSLAVQEPQLLTLLHRHLAHMKGATKAPDIALELLKLTAALFQRSLTLVMNGSDLIAERSIGIKAERSRGPVQALRKTIGLGNSPSVFRDVIESGHLFFGASSDPILQEHLIREIGQPVAPEILLLPLKCFGRTIAVIYGDFGRGKSIPIDTTVLDLAAQYGSLVLDNAVYRSRQEKRS